MKPISCFYITGGLVTVLAVSLFFAYRKKQEEIKAVLEKERETVRSKEPFRGGGGVALHYGGGGTAGGPGDYAPLPESFLGGHGGGGGGHGGGGMRGSSGEFLRYGGGGWGWGYPWYFAYLGVPVALDYSSTCYADSDCGPYGTCGSTGYCV